MRRDGKVKGGSCPVRVPRDASRPVLAAGSARGWGLAHPLYTSTPAPIGRGLVAKANCESRQRQARRLRVSVPPGNRYNGPYQRLLSQLIVTTVVWLNMHVSMKAVGRKHRLMDLNTQKSRFSLSYIEAVASLAGFQVEETRVDLDSVDGTLRADFGRRSRVEFQAKATARDLVRDGYVHYPLPIKNYDDLRIEAINPRILIVLVMPQSTDQWATQSHEELCLRNCTYWLCLEGKPDTTNQHSITVHLPLTNVFDSVQLSNMMGKVERTGAL